MAAVWTDITDRKRADTRAARDRLRVEFLQLHRLAPQMTDAELHEHVLEQAVRLTDSSVGFLHVVSPDPLATTLSAWTDVTRRIQVAVPDRPIPLEGDGPWQSCIRDRRPVLDNGGLNPPPTAALPQDQPPLRRFMSIPVLQDGQVRIVFGVGEKAGDYTEDDLSQLQVVSNELHKIVSQRAAQNRLRQPPARSSKARPAS